MGIDLTRLDDLVDFDNGDARAFGKARIEVLRAAAEFAVAKAVGTIGGHEGVVDTNCRFKEEGLAVEEADLFALGDRGADSGGCVHASQTGAAGTQTFDQRALRHHLELDLAGGSFHRRGGFDVGSLYERDDQA